MSRQCHFCKKKRKAYILRLLEIEESSGVDRLSGHSVVVCNQCEDRLQKEKIRLEKWRDGLVKSGQLRKRTIKKPPKPRPAIRSTTTKTKVKTKPPSAESTSNLIDLLERRS